MRGGVVGEVWIEGEEFVHSVGFEEEEEEEEAEG